MPDENVDSYIGNKILEVNGTPVVGKSIENIDKLIKNSSSILQLTIEHDPHRLSRSMSDAKCITNRPAQTIPTSPKCRKICFDRSLSVRETSANKHDRHSRKQQNKYDGNACSQPCNSNAENNVGKKCVHEMGTNNLRSQKGRCSSMSKLVDDNHTPPAKFFDLSRTKSFRVDSQEFTPRIFRTRDLVMGKDKFIYLFKKKRGNSDRKEHLHPAMRSQGVRSFCNGLNIISMASIYSQCKRRITREEF